MLYTTSLSLSSRIALQRRHDRRGAAVAAPALVWCLQSTTVQPGSQSQPTGSQLPAPVQQADGVHTDGQANDMGKTGRAGEQGRKE